jgi:hypothetical protein
LALTAREFWMLFHLGLGVLYVHAFASGLAGLSLGARLRRLNAGTWVMAITAWLTVISGTWIVYPWYRAEPPESVANLDAYPKSYLLADPAIAQWHEFGMEWKEHVGWISPILATAVGYVVIRYGPELTLAREGERQIRKALIVLFTIAFLTAVVAAGLGAFINKVAPNIFMDL